MLTPRLLRLYRRTDYVVDGRVHVAVGRRSRDADAMLTRFGARAGVLITGANPRSRTMPEAWNRRMTQRLAAATGATLAAEGRLRGWREQGLFVCGDPRRLARLGRRFRQNALVLVEHGRPARLLLLALPPRGFGQQPAQRMTVDRCRLCYFRRNIAPVRSRSVWNVT